MRDVDDKIIYALNALPTESFKGQVNSESTCRDLYAKLQQSHLARVKENMLNFSQLQYIWSF